MGRRGRRREGGLHSHPGAQFLSEREGPKFWAAAAAEEEEGVESRIFFFSNITRHSISRIGMHFLEILALLLPRSATATGGRGGAT